MVYSLFYYTLESVLAVKITVVGHQAVADNG